ncbi:multidrug resistance-associated protein 5, partial [Tanacetum coccineum]
MQYLSDDLGIVNGEGLTIISDQHKKFEALKDHHRNYKVVPSGESVFEVRNGYEGFKVDERLSTCTFRGWQLTSLPCQHEFAAIYFLYRDPKEYVSKWYKKEIFMSAYNHYIEGMNRMDQWPSTSYLKPLPLIKRRMPERPPHKRKRDVSKNDGRRSWLSRKAHVNRCTLCVATGHNQRACPSKREGSASAVVNTPTMYVRGGTRSSKGGKTPSVSSRGGKKAIRGGTEVSTPSSLTVAFK